MAGWLLSTCRRGDNPNKKCWEFELINPSNDAAIDFFFNKEFRYIVVRWTDDDNLEGYLERYHGVDHSYWSRMIPGHFRSVEAYLHNKRTIPRKYLQHGDAFENGYNPGSYQDVLLGQAPVLDI